ncbi:MAG: hypothetical protein ACRERU_04055 [Methylococcales bacterium]
MLTRKNEDSPIQKKTLKLDAVEEKLMQFLIAEFSTTPKTSDEPMATLGASIVSKYEQNPDQLSRSDLFKLDSIILSILPPEKLAQRVPLLRSAYAEMAGPALAAAYRPPNLAGVEDSDKLKKLLQADAQELQRFIHFSQLFTPDRERLRKDMFVKSGWYMVGATLSWLLWFVVSVWFGLQFLGVLITVIYSGVIGGFISSQRRVQMIPSDGDPLRSYYALENGKSLIALAPGFGAVFAVVLMFLFISKVIEGPIFPKYPDALPIQTGAAVGTGGTQAGQTATATNRQQESSDMADKLERFQFQQFLPVDAAAYALLFLWSFIAGFAERFVPDALDRLMTRAQGDAKPAPANLASGMGPTFDNRVGSTLEATPESRSEATSVQPSGSGQFTYVSETDDSLEDGSDIHLCDSGVPIQDITEDDELPAAKGGVA